MKLGHINRSRRIYSANGCGLRAYPLASKSLFPLRVLFPFLSQYRTAPGRIPIPCSVRERKKRYACGKKSKDCSRTETRDDGGHLRTEAEKLPREERAGGVEKDVLVEKAVPEFCLVLTELTLQLVITGERKEVETVIQPPHGVSFDADKLDGT